MLFRSLKGAALSVELADIERKCQAVESQFARLKKDAGGLTQNMLDLINAAMNDIEAAVKRACGGGSDLAVATADEPVQDAVAEPVAVVAAAPIPCRDSTVTPTIPDSPPATPPACPDTLAPVSPPPRAAAAAARPAPLPASAVTDTAEPGDAQSPGGAAPSDAAAPGKTGMVRIDVAKLDALLLRAEELLQVKMAVEQRGIELRQLLERLRETQRREALAADAAGLPRHDFAATFVAELGAISRAMDADRRTTALLIDQLLAETKKVVMLPLSTITVRLPKIVRDLARDEGKFITCDIHGEALEVDKRILDALRDPLLHLLRNCVDHGIEKPEARVARGKPERGQISLTITRTGGDALELLVADDGGGVDAARLKAAAVTAGRVTADQAATMPEAQALALLFESGVSTSEILTRVSGRGLGMAIVRDTVEGFGGTVTVSSTLGQGTQFRLQLPLTVATYQGTLVEAEGQKFVLPTAGIDRVTRVRRDHIRTLENRETIVVADRPMSLVRLADILGLPGTGKTNHAEFLPVAVVRSGAACIALAVDQVLREQEILAKGLGPQLLHVPNVSGSTVLASGELVLILNTAELVRAADTQARGATEAPGAATAPGEPATKRVLVVEDSITARVLIQSVLQSAGYTVLTAVDGMDGLATLRTEAVDVVVSDVDMPRMNGFELTTKIRASANLDTLPVILVTARESREDRERGIEAGASAYIAKSTFDQTDLLEVIQRFV